MAITFDPMALGSAAGSFKQSTQGYTQGAARPNFATRQSLKNGALAATETLPMWAGLPVQVLVGGSNGTTGKVARATAAANLMGFSTRLQDIASVKSPSSPVPTAGAGQDVNFFTLGSGQELALPINAAFAATFAAGTLPINTALSWDFTANEIVAFNAGLGALPVKLVEVSAGNGRTVTYNAVTGAATWNEAGSIAIVEL